MPCWPKPSAPAARLPSQRKMQRGADISATSRIQTAISGKSDGRQPPRSSRLPLNNRGSASAFALAFRLPRRVEEYHLVSHHLGRGPASAVLSFEIADSQPARYPNQPPFGQVLGNGRRQLSPGDHIDEVSLSIAVGAGRSAGDGQDKPGPGNPLTRRPHLRISSQATDQHDLNTSPPERFGRFLPGIRSDHEDGVDETPRPWSPGVTVRG